MITTAWLYRSTKNLSLMERDFSIVILVVLCLNHRDVQVEVVLIYYLLFSFGF